MALQKSRRLFGEETSTKGVCIISYLLGVDLGTSSIKSVVLKYTGEIAAIGQQNYDITIPEAGYAEQAPDMWYQAFIKTIEQVKAKGIDLMQITSVGFSGQMHGAVMLDNKGSVLYNAILWCDQRTKEQVERIKELFETKELFEMVSNPVSAGFQLVSLMWMKENHPEIYSRIQTVILPKDYIRYRLTENIATDISDASGTLAFDVKNRCWNEEIVRRCGLNKDIFPSVSLSHEISGTLSKTAARETGLREGTAVVYGGADQPVQAIANGVFDTGTASCTIGTGGQLLMPTGRPNGDPGMRVHLFNHTVTDMWYLMGATLNAGLSLKWITRILNIDDFSLIDQMIEKIPAGSDGLIFLPYLTGERTPHMNPGAKGMFFGMTLKHDREAFIRAAMEGVVFSLRQTLDIFEELKVVPEKIIASGGGAKSPIWLQMQADIFQTEIYVSNNLELAGVGAAMLAGVGSGVYSGIKQSFDCVNNLSQEPVRPNRSNYDIYMRNYDLYKDLYISNKKFMEV